jgi:hypothetical protein
MLVLGDTTHSHILDPTILKVVHWNPSEYTIMWLQVLDTGGTFLDELNTQTGMSFVGGRRNSDWSDIEKHGTHVGAANLIGRGKGKDCWADGV